MNNEELIERVANMLGNSNSKYLKWRLETAKEIISVIASEIRKELERATNLKLPHFWERWEK